MIKNYSMKSKPPVSNLNDSARIHASQRSSRLSSKPMSTSAKVSSSLPRKNKTMKERMNNSMIEKRAVLCDECKRRTIDRASLGASSSRIEAAGFVVTKGNSSFKGRNNNNLWSSRINENNQVKLEHQSTMSH